jgi:hypothetical protein
VDGGEEEGWVGEIVFSKHIKWENKRRNEEEEERPSPVNQCKLLRTKIEVLQITASHV